MTEQWAAYTRLGASFVDVDQSSPWNGQQSSQDWDFAPALGLKYRINPQWTVRAEYQFIDGVGNKDTQQTDLNFTSVGFSYHFGQSSSAAAKAAPVLVAAAATEDVTQTSSTTQQKPVKITAQFDVNSTVFVPTPELDNLLSTTQAESVKAVEVAIYTDSYGSTALNQRLSDARAKAVKQYLITRGIDANIIRATGYGESNFITDNNTRKNRDINRRAEVSIDVIIEVGKQ